VAPASIVSVAPAPAPAPTVDETRNDRSQSAEASDGSGSGSGSENATDECPWDLQAMHRRGINANYLLPPILEAMMSWTVSAEPDAGDQLTVRFSLRDENGLQAGAEHYSCHREGLRLTAVTTAIRRVTFEPPLLVLPSTEGNREAHGRIVFNDDGNEEILAYSWSSVTQNAGVVDEYSGSSGLRRRVTSVLDTGSERHARRWSTMTEWLVTPELVVATRRFQTVGIDDESAAREERLDVLYQGDERVY
jgi:hypothetical protein